MKSTAKKSGTLILTLMLGLTGGTALAFPGNTEQQTERTTPETRFSQLDADGNGAVSWEELHAANSGISRQAFDVLDKNKDGGISLDEWQAFASSHGKQSAQPAAPRNDSMPLLMPPVAPVERNASPEERFSQMDANSDGAVSWEELHAANSGISRQTFEVLDKNRDGGISLDEWRAFAASHNMKSEQPTAGQHGGMPLLMPPTSPQGADRP